ncbi:MAG: hypothetical protein Q4D80_02855 [Pseudomonadota bacterium]|nr:hypothetical protein [Pseudomonadota bacterium]
MKRRNFSKSIIQKGGLMIEALAMLGLIAVVTPTMYKKSAERTMEVEDINTATTIRTISNAANDYVAANYSTLLGDMVKNSENTRTLQLSDLSTYLPYGFNVEKALYNYDGNNIQVSVARQGNNLTTLLLFPAKLDEENGIGQERTARIAALIGSSGGYTTGEHSARGIGGIWKLENDDFTNNFTGNPNTYSIVTASADTISASAGNELDYTKYLQRGRDAGDGVDSLWKNTMRTDLYMGGPSSTEDLYQDATGPWSIRNIKSLIVGADNGPQSTDPDSGETTETGGYGLYIANSAANPNAYVHGSLEAGNGQLKADETNLQYGNITAADGTQEHGFNVDTAGNLSNLRNLNLASSIKTAAKDGWESIKIGALPTRNSRGMDNYVIQASRESVQGGTMGGTVGGHLTLLGEDIISLNGYEPGESPNNNLLLPEKVKILQDGWKRTAGPTSAEFDPIKYNTDVEAMPLFPVSVGANTKIDALLATRQLDTQRIRAAELSVGSENINDELKWLNANKDGVLIRDNLYDGDWAQTFAKFNGNGIFLRYNEEDSQYIDQNSDHKAQINLYADKNFQGKTIKNIAEVYGGNVSLRGTERLEASSNSVIIQAARMSDYAHEDNDDGHLDETIKDNTLLLRNWGFEARMHDTEFRIGERNDRDSDEVGDKHDHRTLFENGHVDLADANLKIIRNLDGQHRPVFSVRGNNDVEGQSFEGDDFSGAINDCFTRPDATANSEWEAKYDVAIHGALSVSPYGDTKPSTAVAPVANISVGRFNHHSGINIVTKKYNAGNLDQNIVANNYNLKDKQAHNILMIDQGATKDKNNNVTMSERETGNFLTSNRTDPGTIYMRKGYMEVHGERSVPTTTSTNGAFDGNGVIAASRFVANNPVSGSHGYKVPQLVKDEKLTQFEGTGINRYDTYMVNPAYTSVMHDIKLTTRGGARLSDILPDFINKGIYLVNNSYLEEGASNSLALTEWAQKDDFKQVEDGKLTIGSDEAWASPYLGSVPAPQCPPGYGRVITLAPSSFQMGIAGQVQKGDNDIYYVYPEILRDPSPSDSILQKMAENKYTFKSASVEGTVETRVNGTPTPSDSVSLSTVEYVLTAPTNDESYMAPVTIQQSTWLKTSTRELCGKPKCEAGDYVRGWATYMGFLYLSDLYPASLQTAKPAYQLGSTSIYWNLFPVLNRTLEGYATVYCYFDRKNLYGGRNSESDYDYIDKAEYLTGTSEPPTSFEKGGSPNYKNRLNDPNLKYNEVW